eukprot:1140400-Pelagomonas_calceolata.AAC.6
MSDDSFFVTAPHRPSLVRLGPAVPQLFVAAALPHPPAMVTLISTHPAQLHTQPSYSQVPQKLLPGFGGTSIIELLV